jgi:hypothetical protein
VFELSAATGDIYLRNPQGLVTGVWDIYNDWRQVCEICTVTCEKLLTYLPRLAIGVWRTTKTGDKCLTYLPRLATSVWRMYQDWRQVFDVSTKTGDRCLTYLPRLATGVWRIYQDWRKVFDVSTKTGDKCLTYLPRLATSVWHLYQDWRQVFDVSTKTGDKCLMYLPRIATGVWRIYQDWRQVFDCWKGWNWTLAHCVQKQIYPMFSGGQDGDSVKQPTHRYGVYAAALLSQTLRCGALPNRQWLHSKQRKTAVVLINTQLCCGVRVGCGTSSVRISEDETEVLSLFGISYGVCVGGNLVCSCEKRRRVRVNVSKEGANERWIS